MMGSRAISVTLTIALLILLISSSVVVGGDSKNGTFAFTLYGYTITGNLSDAIITHEGNVQLQMSIDQTVPTSVGSVHITGNGVWDGRTDFAAIGGSIGNVQGVIQACLLGVCKNANFTGTGDWTGMLTWSKGSGSQGSGGFHGTLNFTSKNSTKSGPVPVSGNWTATFAI